MTAVNLTGNFLSSARGISLADGGGIVWAFNKNTNTLTGIVAGALGGTVTSVGLASANADITVTGATPITAAGAWDLALKTQGAITPASYTYAAITVNSKGVITAVANGTQPVTSITSSNLTVAGTAAMPTINLTAGQVTNIALAATAVQPAGLPVGANPAASVGLSTVNGSAGTWMRSDAAPPLDQSISPTMTGNWSFTGYTTGAFAHTVQINPTVPSTATSRADTLIVVPSTVAAVFTVPTLDCFDAQFGTKGSGSTITNLIGFRADTSLTAGTNNYGFKSELAAGSSTWAFHATGTAASFFGGVVQSPASPLVATVTQVVTGLAAYRNADTTATSNTLTADAQLTLTFNETGKYAIEIFLPFYEATLGTGGFQFDLNSGSATVGGVVYGVDGFVTAAVANAAVTSISTATTAGTVATSSSAPSWFLAKGWMSVTVAGTAAVRWAQNTTLLADPTTLKAGAYFLATKIG